jgi:hypothetical protein
MFGIIINILSALREPGATILVARAILQPLIVLTILTILALALHEWIPDF